MQIKGLPQVYEQYDTTFEVENSQNSDGFSVISSVDQSTTSSRSNSPPIQINNSQSKTDFLQELNYINVQRTEDDKSSIPKNDDQDESSIPKNNDQAAIHTQNINVTHSSSTSQDGQLTNSDNFSGEETGSSSRANNSPTGLNDDPSNYFDDMTEILSELDKNQNEEVQSPTTDQVDDQFLKTTDKSRTQENVDVDYKKHIRAAIESHKYYKNDPSINITYGKDLSEYIPGLYRLLDLCKDDGSNGLGI
ncbi:12163_t:CDS:2 [Dentiscutata heterogama]|uniref:12163_t:CDS:1 n=1 Tax=Dentiscutata heterogama TaxID=1316150 RepID=A0ACA9JV29_9GLOM|nr:12163_t:CDS:2 [Dentiscutata heterogama]